MRRHLSSEIWEAIVKTVVRYALEADKPAHLLLSGPPASASQPCSGYN